MYFVDLVKLWSFYYMSYFEFNFGYYDMNMVIKWWFLFLLSYIFVKNCFIYIEVLFVVI